jgi:hypothetical protein
MSDTLRAQMQVDLEALGWECHESESAGHWTTTFTRNGMAIVSSGADRQMVWNAAYKDALRHCGQLAHISTTRPPTIQHKPA